VGTEKKNADDSHVFFVQVLNGIKSWAPGVVEKIDILPERTDIEDRRQVT
jgi:hypothetical protein